MHPGVGHKVRIKEGAEGAECEYARNDRKGSKESKTSGGIVRRYIWDDVFDDQVDLRPRQLQRGCLQANRPKWADDLGGQSRKQNV